MLGKIHLGSLAEKLCIRLWESFLYRRRKKKRRKKKRGSEAFLLGFIVVPLCNVVFIYMCVLCITLRRKEALR